MIRQVGNAWVLYSKKGKPLGRFRSRKAALGRERQVNAFKYRTDAKEHTVNLLKARRALGLSTRRRRVPRQLPAKLIEREYARRLLGLVGHIKAALQPLRDALPALLESAAKERRVDAGEGRTIRELLALARQRITGVFNARDIEEIADSFARRTATHNKEQLGRQIKAALGVDVFMADKAVPAIIEAFRDINVGLMQDLSRKVVNDIENATLRAVQLGTPSKDLAADLDRQFDLGENRAKLIARDQIGKLQGQINATRQQELGVDKFIWRTVSDERVRPEHEDRDGEIYPYDDPPDGELPGEPINCRCYAEPVFDGINDAVEEE